MEQLLHDLRFALRTLARRPLITIAAILCLGLGIGATTAVFSLVNSILLRPLPYPGSEHLYNLWLRFPNQGVMRSPGSGKEFVDLREQHQTFSEVAGMIGWYFNLSGVEPPVRLLGARASASLFRLLGTQPVLGRPYTDEEQERGDAVVVLSHGLWQRSFGGDPDIIDRTILLDQKPYTIVGVMPAGFRAMPTFAEVWVPLVPNPAVARNTRGVAMLARLAENVDRVRAQNDLDVIEQRFTQEYPDIYPQDGSWGIHLIPLYEAVVGDVAGRLRVFLGAVVLVLLIACINVANLLLSQATEREKEIALRSALGASRRSIWRQLLTESVLLALFGGTVGVLLAWAGTKGITLLRLGNLPRLEEIGLDGRVLAVSLVVSIASGIGFGLAPALRLGRVDLQSTLKEGGRTAAAGGRHTLRSMLVVFELALALVVLVGTGLMLRSFQNLQAVDPGFRTQDIATFQVYLAPGTYANDQAMVGFYRQLREKLRALQGVEGVGLISSMPFGRSRLSGLVHAEGSDPTATAPSASWNAVSPELFENLEITLERGRPFNELDHELAAPVVIVDSKLARQLWPDRDPIGQRLRLEPSPSPVWRTVVGVVSPVHQASLMTETTDQIYVPYPQYPFSTIGATLRTRADLSAIAAAVRRVVAEIDPIQPVADIQTLESMVQESLAGPRFNMLLFALFGTIAFVLAAIGVYGVIAYSVALRGSEIAIRRALGAQHRDVLRMIVGESGRLALTGLGIGLVLALALGRGLDRLLTGMVYGIETTDFVSFAAVVFLLLATALTASFLPAWRALGVDPMTALRQE